MSTTPLTKKTTRFIAKVAVASTLLGVAAAGVALPASADAAPPVGGTPYSNCPGSPCIIRADINTSGSTVKFRGDTMYLTEGSQWFLTVRRNGVVVKTYASEYLATNILNVDLGVLPPGGAYEMTVLAGTSHGDQLLVKNFTTSPTVVATPTATNVNLAFSMTVGTTAKAMIRKQDGTLVATANSTGAAKVHSLTTAAILNPNTIYKYQVDATDAQGRIYTKTGAFLTRNVRLEVKLTGLQINNDSDYIGAGELRAQLHVGGAKAWIWQSEKSVETAFGAKYYAISTAANLPSATRSVPISVVVSDDDCEGIGSLCSTGGGDLSIGSGTVSDTQWATATFTANLPNTTTTTGWTTFISTTNNPVGFTMAGQYRWVMV